MRNPKPENYRDSEIYRGLEIKQIIRAESKEVDTSFILEESIFILDLSSRALNCLMPKYPTIGELIAAPSNTIRSIRNLGKNTFEEVQSKLAEFNLFLQVKPSPLIMLDDLSIPNNDVSTINRLIQDLEQKREKLIKKEKRKGVKKGIN